MLLFKRIIYRLIQWKRVHENIIEISFTEDHGWLSTSKGFMESQQSEGPVLPPQLIDLLIDVNSDDGLDDKGEDDGKLFW